MENTNSSEQIIIEKRKRHQAYAMDYLISVGTYFDFFSIDAFKLIECKLFSAKN
jgi:hypothetical protein